MLDDELFISETTGILRSLIEEGMGLKECVFSGPFPALNLKKGLSADELWISAGDAAIELGHPSSESICLELMTRQPGLIVDGRVSVLGDDLPDLSRGRYSLALIIMVETPELSEENRYALAGKLSVCGNLAGCMTRVISGRIWIRFDKEALARGLTLSAVGGHIISELRKEADKFSAAEVIFIVAGSDQINRFRPVADGYAERSRIRYKEEIAKRADCDNPFDCDECPDTVDCQVFKEALIIAAEKERMS